MRFPVQAGNLENLTKVYGFVSRMHRHPYFELVIGPRLVVLSYVARHFGDNKIHLLFMLLSSFGLEGIFVNFTDHFLI